MKIVIEMPEEEYNKIKENDCGLFNGRIYQMIRNGTPLSEGHGNLIDVNELELDTEWNDYEDGFISYSHNQIKYANVIIEADTESED